MPARIYASSVSVTNCLTAQRAGVNAVLRACTKLETLHLLHCTGPFSDRLVDGIAAARGHAWFKDLRIVGSSARMTEAGVLQLVGRCVSAAALSMYLFVELTDKSLAWPDV